MTTRALRVAIVLPVAFMFGAACSGGQSETAEDTITAAPAAGRTTDSAAGTSDMAGMDHSKMPMGPSDTGAAAMAGMDHSTMPGMDDSTMPGMDHSGPARGGAQSAPSGGSMAGMDHSNMPTPARGATGARASGMAGMDHSQMNMPGTTRPSGAARPARAGQAMAGMDHAAMGHGATPAPRTARRTTSPSPEAGHEMHQMPVTRSAPDSGTLKLQRLVARLVEDPAVRQRIQADTVLRNRWRDPDVREVILP